jgi:hypothetical protein
MSFTLAQIIAKLLIVLWGISCGAIFLPPSRRDAVADLLRRIAGSIPRWWRALAVNVVASGAHILVALLLSLVLLAMMLAPLMKAAGVDATPIGVLALSLVLLAASLAATVRCVRLLLAALPSPESPVQWGMLSLRGILTPIAAYRTHGFENIFAVAVDAILMVFFVWAAVGQLAFYAVVYAARAIVGLICITAMLFGELVCFPVLLAARFNPSGSGRQLFALLGWIVVVVAAVLDLAFTVADYFRH